MKKNRKTRKQKIKSDARRETQIPIIEPLQQPTHITHSLTGIALPSLSTPSHTNNSTKYAYVLHDMRNTLTILVLIVAANLTLYFFINQGIIKLAW